ncbi:MAG: multidrug effflux MFS transporter [Paracoccus sp. (in: a-proteobacteria)]|uniref:multidrug effflux MFS transporter n=1 Tax=Paracoccus sp. TaxID=267 RepID=UPI0026DFE1C8|nr:multidrug effflux MFS transporter [Paracoccus sp. (in: a-proteobacteria)]MDO5612852.1 multidrug effflux MFS transporter [Paracoccus sp. (in: a-proteobacteria)]
MTGIKAPSLLTLVAMAGLGALATNIFLPSLPHMAQDFGTDYATIQLSVSGYLATSAVLQLMIGPISDRFGRRPVMIGALLIFLLATCGALMATNIWLFLLFRMAQAVSAAGMVLSRAVIRDLSGPDQAASRLGYVTMGMSVVPMMAPALGGILEESIGWHGSFAVMLGAGVIVLILVWTDLSETAQGGGIPLRQQMAGYPVLARSVRFWGYALAATTSSGAFFAYLGGAPFVGQEIYGLTPGQLGWWFGAPSVGYFLGNYISGRWSVRFGINLMVLAGSIIVAAALLVGLALDLWGLRTPLAFFGPVVVMGLGNGLVLPSANAGMMSVRPELAGTASGLGGAMAIAGGAFLAALAARMLDKEAGAAPLLTIMVASALGTIVAILWGMARERQILRSG